MIHTENLKSLRSSWSVGLSELKMALIITRREIKDTLRDWRIMVPIVILVTIFPFLANFAAARGLNFVNQYGAKIIMERLLPFLMLAVGFFPSTFSLVIALESFAGEKERRSLEPLLSTPLTDMQFYLGKLISSTFPPVVASYLGMLVYMVALRFTVNWQPEFGLILVSFIVSTAEALVMVAGAVVISSQSTSVRGANLLASFIILPMAFLLQAEAGLLLFGNYTALWLIALALVIVNILLLRLGVKSFNREHLLGRDLDQIDFQAAWRTFKKAIWSGDGLKALYTREIPAQLRAIRPELIVTVLVAFVGGALVGIWGAREFPLPPQFISFEALSSKDSINAAVRQVGLLPEFSIGYILLNNARIMGIGAIASIFSLGVLGQLLLMIPTTATTYFALQLPAAGYDPWLFVAASILPHGIIELPATVIATAQGMKIGDSLLRSPEEGGGVGGVIREMGHFIKLMLALIIPLLLIAAAIEAYITPILTINYFNMY